MFGAYVRFKCNYAALRKSSDNQQQHLFLEQRWIIGNSMWIWLSTSSQRRILDLGNKVFQDSGKLNSLKRESVKKWVFLRACFLSWWATLTHVHTTKKTMICNFWYRHSQPLGRSQVYTELSSHVSIPYLVRFNIYFYTIII